MRISRKISAIIIGATLASLAISMILWQALGQAGMVIAPALFTGSIFLAIACMHSHLRTYQTQCHYALVEKTSNDYKQLEALSSLLWTLTPDLPLPRMRGWSARPTF